MEELYNDRWKLEISETQYDPESTDNIVNPDAHIVICDDYTKSLLLSVASVDHSIEKSIVFTVSYMTPRDDIAFLEGDFLFLFLNDVVIRFNLLTAEIDKKVKLNIMGTLFSTHRYQDDFILYCEMDIIRLTRELEVIWDFSARDIFVRYHGEEPAFEMHPETIRLYDFSDNYYEIDYDGHVIKD